MIAQWKSEELIAQWRAEGIIPGGDDLRDDIVAIDLDGEWVTIGRGQAA